MSDTPRVMSKEEDRAFKQGWDDAQRSCKTQKKGMVAEFLSRLHILHRKIIDENLKRGMKAKDHVEYNDHFNREFDEWEKRK